MQTKSPLFNDFFKIASGGIELAQGLQKEAQTVIQSQVEEFLTHAGFVRREEYDVLFTLVQKQVIEIEMIKSKVVDLEQKLQDKLNK
jgi:BMFP domain-containing protein YqiC